MPSAGRTLDTHRCGRKGGFRVPRHSRIGLCHLVDDTLTEIRFRTELITLETVTRREALRVGALELIELGSVRLTCACAGQHSLYSPIVATVCERGKQT